MTSTGGALGKFAKGRSSNSFLYFAFGSNLSSERIRVQNPSAQYVASAVLDGYQLDFKTYSTRWRGSPATITRTDEASDRVYGILWELDLQHLQTLDDQEGVAKQVYHRFMVPVKPCTVPLEEATQFQEHSCYGPHEVEAYTYQLTPQRLTASAPTDMPSLAYKSVILKGAREHKLPQSYVEELTAIPDNGDGDHVDLRSAVANLDPGYSSSKA